MPDIRWIGQAAAVAQVDTLTVGGTVEASDVFSITMTDEMGNAKTLDVVAGSTNVDTVAATIAAAFNALDDYRFSAVTATAVGSGGELTLEADIVGKPFYCTVATTETGGGAADAQTFSRAATTASSGLYDWNSTDNWDTGAVPGGAASQNVYIEGATIYYGLVQSAIGNTLDSLHLIGSVVGKDDYNGFGPEYLQIKATTLNINKNIGAGSKNSSKVNVDLGTTGGTVNVYAGSGSPGVRLKLNSATVDVNVYGGTVHICNETLETGQLDVLTVDGQQASVYVGSGVTLDDVLLVNGSLVLHCGVTTGMEMQDGKFTVDGTGTIASLTQYGGASILSSSGTITAYNLISGSADFTQSTTARTVTTMKVDPGGTIKYDPGVLTLTNQIQPYTTTKALKYVCSAA